jgi:hypothetical protein
MFAPACDEFASLIFELHSEGTAQMEHGQIETLISLVGTEVLRLLMQAHLDVRALGEPRRHDVTGADDAILTRCREKCERTLATTFGDVTARRKVTAVPVLKVAFHWMESSTFPKTNTRMSLDDGRRREWLSIPLMKWWPIS